MIRSLTTFLALLAVAQIAAAGPPPGKGPKGKPAGKGSAMKVEGRGKSSEPPYFFTVSHERIIRDWFADTRNVKGLPPGLAKRESLPPGLQKQLVRNGTLPPGLEKKLHPCPPRLDALLPRLPTGHRRVILGSDILILDERTSAIVDILRGVVRLGLTM